MSKQKYKDHLGNEYESENQMCSHYNISQTAFRYRINKMGMSLEDALTAPHKEYESTAITCTDHLGNKFATKAAMCDYWHIPRTTYFRRIRCGWTLKDALTKPIKSNMKTHIIKDHLGNQYQTVDEMCAHWHITKKQYMINIRNNCNIEEALTTTTEWTTCKDHLGNEYASINEMCKHYGTNKSALRSRIELGWTLKEILENPKKRKPGKKIKDHLGNKYDSVKQMLNYYGVSETTFRHRTTEQHMPLEKALSPESAHCIKCKDHLGNEFNTLTDMLDYWNISTATYHKRIESHSLKYSLTHISKSMYNSFGPGLKIIKRIDNKFYEVKLNDVNYIWSDDQLWSYYRQHKEKPKKHMDKNKKVFKYIYDDKDVYYIVAQTKDSAENKIKRFARKSNYDCNLFECKNEIEYTSEMLDIFSDASAGIYNQNYIFLGDYFK